MNRDEILKIVCETQEESNRKILDKFDQVSIGLRESLTPSHSKIMKEVREDLLGIREDIEQIRISVQPAVDAVSASRIIGKFTVWLAGVLIAISGVWLFFKEIVKSASR